RAAARVLAGEAHGRALHEQRPEREQLYPLDVDGIRREVAKYADAEVVWVQDEPENQGAWSFVHVNLPEDLPRVRVVSRPASASTAAGTAKKHQAQQAVLLEQAFAR
ncbi:MAG: multifunctional oxoglutarate decarboxylase/oxoglutarate dehydrogenase thiamine, partial [Oerskovia sp.]|nr:multifunctional oxoglutarate decarboxylase/oxoglutarate dehydrogenase thiamine [Oerskovia sp.]